MRARGATRQPAARQRPAAVRPAAVRPVANAIAARAARVVNGARRGPSVRGGVVKPVARRGRSVTRAMRATTHRPALKASPTVVVNGAIGYYSIVLQNGVQMHLFGERHDRYTSCAGACKPPDCLTLSRYLAKLVQNARASGKWLDVFLEYRLSWASNNQDKATRRENTSYGSMKARFGFDHSTSALNTLAWQVGFTPAAGARAGPVRAHFVDNRDTEHLVGGMHEELWGTSPTPAVFKRYAAGIKDLQRSLVLSMNSDRYSRDIAKTKLQPNQRNRATRPDGGGDVSRVRKALLKLRPEIAKRLRDFAASKFVVRRPRVTRVLPIDVMVLRMDVYAVARMLYYAGYGVTRPPATSSVQFGHAGLFHTQNWKDLLVASGVVASVRSDRSVTCVRALRP